MRNSYPVSSNQWIQNPVQPALSGVFSGDRTDQGDQAAVDNAAAQGPGFWNLGRGVCLPLLRPMAWRRRGVGCYCTASPQSPLRSLPGSDLRAEPALAAPEVAGRGPGGGWSTSGSQGTRNRANQAPGSVPSSSWLPATIACCPGDIKPGLPESGRPLGCTPCLTSLLC